MKKSWTCAWLCISVYQIHGIMWVQAIILNLHTMLINYYYCTYQLYVFIDLIIIRDILMYNDDVGLNA